MPAVGVLLDAAQKRKPDVVLLLDYPGFNLRLAKIAKKAGVKVLYYISPQVWAWNRGRIPKMARDYVLLKNEYSSSTPTA